MEKHNSNQTTQKKTAQLKQKKTYYLTVRPKEMYKAHLKAIDFWNFEDRFPFYSCFTVIIIYAILLIQWRGLTATLLARSKLKSKLKIIRKLYIEKSPFKSTHKSQKSNKHPLPKLIVLLVLNWAHFQPEIIFF